MLWFLAEQNAYDTKQSILCLYAQLKSNICSPSLFESLYIFYFVQKLFLKSTIFL